MNRLSEDIELRIEARLGGINWSRTYRDSFSEGARFGFRLAIELAAEEVEKWQQFWIPGSARMYPPVSPLHISDRVRALAKPTGQHDDG